jgi:alpha-galactosidase
MSSPVAAGGWLALRRAGVLLALDVAGPHLPRIVHWGGDLGELGPTDFAALPAAAYEAPTADGYNSDVPVTLSPTRAQGWPGWPGLTGHRAGAASQPLFLLDSATTTSAAGEDTLSYTGIDAQARLRLEAQLVLTADGVLRHRQTLTSTAAPGDEPYVLDDLVSLLPVSEHAVEVLDHAGRWALEAQPQRRQPGQGTWLREQRRGRTGPDAPLLLTIGTVGFGYRAGEVWGIHLGWSGDQRCLAQRLNTGVALLGAGEILGAGEVILEAGQSFTTPWVYGVWSDRGLDGASARLHRMLRLRPGHPPAPRPVVLNTWEAVYFDQSFERLAALADVAAQIGVERFVVDDGWFGSRRDDRSGLGDWRVSDAVWPEGLGPIADHVRSRGMDFGLWFEPEMANPDSDLARNHPDWLLGTAGRMPPPSRAQHVLDLGHPDAYAYLSERISALVDEYDIAFLKWDHNRDTADPVHRGGPRAGRPAMHEQMLALYRLLAELKSRHPGLEIESCSSGGARIDYGVLEHTDRVWASDCIDPLERIRIVAGVSTLVPYELIGAHVASARSHTTGRTHDLALRSAVALFGHTGFEWDLTELPADVLQQLAEWVALAKSLRPLVHSGELVRVDRPADPATVLYGVVSDDRHEALFNFVQMQAAPRYGAAPIAFAGLDPALRYRVHRIHLPGEQFDTNGPITRPPVDDIETSGGLLMRAGISAPTLRPEQAVVYRLVAS